MARKNKTAEVAILGEKGRLVIPAKIRLSMGLKARTKLLVYACGSSIVLKKLDEPGLSKELEVMYKRIDERIAQYGELTQEEIDQVIHENRKAQKNRKKIGKREIEELKADITKLKPILDKVSMEEIVGSIRDDRESR